MRVDPSPIDNAAEYRQGATVRIETLDGQAVTNTVLVPKGAAGLDVDWPDIEAKYRALAPHAPLQVSKVESSLATIRNFRASEDVAGLLEQLH